MIISASRRTDIPAFYSEWMMERLREGFVHVRNPFNARQVSRVSLLRQDAEMIVFWTKDASNMIGCLDEMDGMGHRYLFEYTLTPYGRDIEPGVEKKRALEALERLSAQIGKKRVIWRYDPILLNEDWTAERHIRAFERMCARLEGAAERCVISFVDLYAAVKRSAPGIASPDEAGMRMLAREMAKTARRHQMIPSACAEALDFSGEGLERRGCIDERDVEAVLGAKVSVQRDSTQRTACLCVKSVDIGAYDTCRHGCIYCYARTGRSPAGEYDVHSPMLCGCAAPGDRVTERREKRIADAQLSIFD